KLGTRRSHYARFRLVTSAATISKYAHGGSAAPMQMPFAGLVGHIRHSTMEQLSRFAYDAVPLKGGAGIDFIGLDMIVAQDALIGIQLGIRQLSLEEIPGGIPRVIAFNPGKA